MFFKNIVLNIGIVVYQNFIIDIYSFNINFKLFWWLGAYKF